MFEIAEVVGDNIIIYYYKLYPGLAFEKNSFCVIYNN